MIMKTREGEKWRNRRKGRVPLGPIILLAQHRSKWAIDEKGKRSKWTYNLGPKRKGYSFDTSRFLFLTP